MTTLAPPDPRQRHDELPPPEGWTIVWRGRTWHETQVTGSALGVLAILNGRDDWSDLSLTDSADPPSSWRAVLQESDPRHGYVRLMSMITALIAADTETGDGQGVAAAVEQVRSAPLIEILSALRA